jgi:hypothetical protein
MKNYVVAIALLLQLVTLSSFAQSAYFESNTESKKNIELLIVKNSELPLSNKEHVYLLQVNNNSNVPIEIKIVAENVVCLNRPTILFEHLVYQENSTREISDVINNIKIEANGSALFYVKLINNLPDKLNTWNCTEVKAIGINKTIVSDSLLIESFIPDTKDFR